MAHQTFYIDIDEEITSIVERLRKSKAGEVVIVVPKRALLIQSIINLKLLKKEADELRKKIIVVTQDKFGKLMVEKTGIAVEQRLENVGSEEMEPQENPRGEALQFKDNLGIEPKKDKKNRLDDMGSPGFFGSEQTQERMSVDRADKEIKKSPEGERLTNMELVTGITKSLKSKKGSEYEEKQEKSGSENIIKNLDIRQKSSVDFENDSAASAGYFANLKKDAETGNKAKKKFFESEKLAKKYGNENDFDSGKDPERMARDIGGFKGERSSGNYGNINLPKKSRRSFWIFALIAVVFALLAAAYLFLPKAEVTIFIAAKERSMDIEVAVDAEGDSIDFEKRTIPGRLISADEDTSRNFDSTGTVDSSNHKARGTITIYNEYSSADQPLVATTRFLSEDGKLFRLISGIIVPGVTVVGTESEPGAIEAQVVADQPGEEFNIEPTRFSIPGFQNSEKHAKIYAKSFKPMVGGGTGGDTVRSVTQGDIDSAKEKALSDTRSKLEEKMKNEIGQDYIILDDAIDFSEPIYEISSSAGSITDSFNVKIKMSAKALAFREADIKNMAENILGKGVNEGKKIVEDSAMIEFGKSDADFSGAAMKTKIHAEGKVVSILDLDEIKRGILGKNDEELGDYLGSYPDISKVEVKYTPSFISDKIPLYGSRVEIILDNN